MRNTVSIAALQLSAHERDSFPQRMDGVAARVESAAARADLVVLPEGTLPAYVLGDDPFEQAPVDAALERLARIARRTRTVIACGAAMSIAPNRRPYNAAVLIDADGSIAGRADKLFLWHFDRRWFEGGASLAPISTAIGRIGALVCADGRIPTIARALVDAGAQLIVMPTAWVTSGRDPQSLENVQADLLARVRAFENGVPFVAANKCGTERGMVAYCGKSQIVDADGRIAAVAGQTHEAIVEAAIALPEPRPSRPLPPAVAARTSPPRVSPIRVILTSAALDGGVDRRLDVLGAAHAIAPDLPAARLAALDADIPTLVAADAQMHDPAGLVPYKLAGYCLAIWQTRGTAWTQLLARARALELKMYVAVLLEDRAYAVDPDGTVVAGTFGDYRYAAVTLDPRKVFETSVAPGTDVLEGLRFVDAMLRERGRVPA